MLNQFGYEPHPLNPSPPAPLPQAGEGSFSFPSAPPRLKRAGGGIRRALSEPAGRVAQPPRRIGSVEARPEGVAQQGRLFFGYFLLAKQKKVTSRRATPGQRTATCPKSFHWRRFHPLMKPLTIRLSP